MNKNEHENSIINSPGEYGTTDKPCGWTFFRYKNNVIYLTSEHFSEKKPSQLSEDFYIKHNIPKGNTIDLRKIPESESIEIDNKTNFVLQQFKNEINKVDRNQNILIHCKKGENRTPVAAVIFLLEQGESRVEAEKIVNTALEKRYVLNAKIPTVNARQMYTSVLQQAEINHYPLNKNVLPTASLSPSEVNPSSSFVILSRLGDNQPSILATTNETGSSITSSSSSSSSSLLNLSSNNNTLTITTKPKKLWMTIRESEVKEVTREAAHFIKIHGGLKEPSKKTDQSSDHNEESNENNDNNSSQNSNDRRPS